MGKLSRIHIILLVLVFGLLVLLTPQRIDERQVFVSPLKNSYAAFIKQYAEEGTLKIALPRDDYPENIEVAFTPRDSVSAEGYLVPQNFAGVYYIYGYVYTILGDATFAVINILSALISIMLASVLVRKIFQESRKEDIAVPILILTFAPFLMFSIGSMVPEVLVTVLLATSFYVYLDFIQKKSMSLFVLFCLLAGAVITIRYDVAYFYIICGVFMLDNIKVLFSDKKRLLLSILILGIFAGIVLLTNQEIYGSAFKFGHQVGLSLRRQTALSESLSAYTTKILNLNFNFTIAFSQIYNYFIRHNFIYTALFGLTFIWWIGNIRTERYKPVMKKAFWIILSVFILVGYMNVSRNTFGYEAYIIRSSFMRYMLPYIFLLILLIKAVIPKQEKAVGIVTSVLVFANIVSFLNFGYLEYSTQRDLSKTINTEIIDNVGEDDLIIVGLSDKYIFPERDFLVSSYLAEPGSTNNYSEIERFFQNAPTEELLAIKTSYVLEQEGYVYMTDLLAYDPELRGIGYLLESGYQLEVVQTEPTRIYYLSK